MENNSFQTSFIPKKPLTSSGTNKEPRNFFLMISTFFLIAFILLSAGLYMYRLYLVKQEDSLSASLSATRASFEKDTISELELFDKKTGTAKQILSNHLVLSPMFALLGDITIPQVQYINFSQKTNDKGFLVNIKGLARDYKSIALQAEVFNSVKGRSFTNVLFSNLAKDKNNNVSFDLKFNVDPNLLSYEKNNLLEQTKISDTPSPTTDPLLKDLENKTQ